MHRFVTTRAELDSGRVHLRGAPLRHLRDVLRLAPGARVELFDGVGGAFLAEVVSIGRAAAELRVGERIAEGRESPVEITLAVALSKGAKLDWVVEKATELGVARVVPFRSERTVPERDSFARREGRLRRIAEAAAMQSGRTRTPEIDAVVDLPAVLDLAADHDRSLLFWEGGGRPLQGPGETRILLITGPEGGFSGAEVEAARAAGVTIAGLGPRILRAETAAIAAVTLAQFLWGDLGVERGRSDV